jgi:hypothetical protein
MKHQRKLLYVLALLLICSWAHAQQQSEYARLVAQIKTGDVYINFKRLRMAYVVSPERKNAKDTQKERQLSADALIRDLPAQAIEYLDVVLQSGESKKDAWIVISEEEEKVLLALLEMRTTSHTLIEDGKHRYDVVEIIHPLTGQTEKRYFNLDLVQR